MAHMKANTHKFPNKSENFENIAFLEGKHDSQNLARAMANELPRV